MNLGTKFQLQYATWTTFLLFFFLSSPLPEMAYFVYYFSFPPSYCEISELSKPVNHLQHYF